MVSTRRDLLLLLRKRPGVTVSELATELGLTAMGVRRHLDALSVDGLVAPVPPARRGVGRPPAGWRLTSAGLELFPRRYDRLALELLDDLAANDGADAVEGLLARRTARLVTEYKAELDGVDDLAHRLRAIAKIRDEEGYEATSATTGDGAFVLTEANCAIHQVAAHCPALCAHEHQLLSAVLGPGTEVTRTSHILSGDPVCTYRVRSAASTPAAPA
jgi:predicted ArsR family transcriptional regulator